MTSLSASLITPGPWLLFVPFAISNNLNTNSRGTEVEGEVNGGSHGLEQDVQTIEDLVVAVASA